MRNKNKTRKIDWLTLIIPAALAGLLWLAVGCEPDPVWDDPVDPAIEEPVPPAPEQDDLFDLD